MEEDARGQQDAAESKPTDIQLLVTAISQQLEASQRREDRVVALLEHLCIANGRHHLSADEVDRGDGAATPSAVPSRASEAAASSVAGPSGTDEPSARVAAGGGAQPPRAGRWHAGAR